MDPTHWHYTCVHCLLPTSASSTLSSPSFYPIRKPTPFFPRLPHQRTRTTEQVLYFVLIFFHFSISLSYPQYPFNASLSKKAIYASPSVELRSWSRNSEHKSGVQYFSLTPAEPLLKVIFSYALGSISLWYWFVWIWFRINLRTGSILLCLWKYMQMLGL